LPVDTDNPRQRVHLITLTIWLIARDRYNLLIPTEGIGSLPPQYAALGAVGALAASVS